MNMNEIEIAFIINSFNRYALLKEAINVLAIWVPHSEFANKCGIVVFDAGSTDGSVEWLTGNADNLPLPIFLIRPSQNEDSSFSAGLNKGVSFAGSNFKNLKYLVFYETDNQITSAFALAGAIKMLQKHSDLAACGFTVRKHNGLPAGTGMPFLKVRNFILGKNLVSKFQLEAIKYKWSHEENNLLFSYVDVVFTSPLVVKIDIWKKSGGLDAKLFPFATCDIDWAKRLSDLGFKMGVIKSNDAIHDNLEDWSSWSKNRALNTHRGNLRYVKRHHPYKFYVAWPLPLLIRHLFEYLAVKTFIHEPVRRKQLSEQYLTLLKKCLKQYE